MRTLFSQAIPLAAFVAALLGVSIPASAAVNWIRQLGSTENDAQTSVSVDALGNVFIAGYTHGDLAGPNAGETDAFVSRYDATGVLHWTRQFGTDIRDVSTGVATDGLGNVYVSRNTDDADFSQAYLSKYDIDGTELWTQQIGTTEANWADAVAVDAQGNAYVSGYIDGDLGGPNAGRQDAFLSKFDASGSPLWTRQLGTTRDERGYGVATDGLGNIYIGGSTTGELAGQNSGNEDVFLGKYNSDGDLEWTRQVESTEFFSPWSISADALGNVFVGGITQGIDIPTNGVFDAFVIQYDADGNHGWTRLHGSGGADAGSVVADGQGNVYLAGYTFRGITHPLSGDPIPDAFVSKFDSSGHLLWSQQLGTTSAADGGWRADLDGLGGIYLSGSTESDLGATNAGETDAFVAKLTKACRAILTTTARSTRLITSPGATGWARFTTRPTSTSGGRTSARRRPGVVPR
jgi:hypothetical protein